jgi:hypothetical protein
VYIKPYDLVLLLVPALARPGWKLLLTLVALSYGLLGYAALSGRGGDVFVWLTVITLAYLVHQDRHSVLGRLRNCRSRLGLERTHAEWCGLACQEGACARARFSAGSVDLR